MRNTQNQDEMKQNCNAIAHVLPIETHIKALDVHANQLSVVGGGVKVVIGFLVFLILQ